MAMHPSVAARLDRLTPDQQAAATAPPGPLLCVAPAGSGKTTTLVARIAWLVDGGAEPSSITAITFNTRAAEELGERAAAALAPLGVEAPGVRVRTFHALGLEILRDHGASALDIVDRAEVCRGLWPDVTATELGRLDTAFSRFKLEFAVHVAAVEADPGAGPMAQAYVAYERALASRGSIDFDDLVRGALAALREDRVLLARWRDRCAHLLVDEVQDVDRSQLDLALLLAAPANRAFMVGDDDQSIYGWRLADVRRVLALADALPGLRRVDLTVNHRCPAPVVDRAVRLIDHNRERFRKTILPRTDAPGVVVLAPDAGDEPARSGRLLDALPTDDDGSWAILARTNRELWPAALVAVHGGIPFRAASVTLPVEDERLPALLDRVAATTPTTDPLLLRLAAVRRANTDPDLDPLVTALLAWSPAWPDLQTFREAIDALRTRLAELRRDDARLTLATAHSTKGAEFDHVAVVGMDVGRFPSGRAVSEALEPERALEEERRLAYVAWTRAKRTLILSYDPGAPSPFLYEAFTPAELSTDATMAP